MSVDIDGTSKNSFANLPQEQVQSLIERYSLIINEEYPIKIYSIDTMDELKEKNESKIYTYKLSGDYQKINTILENLKIINWNSYLHRFSYYKPHVFQNRKGEDIAMTVTIELSFKIDVESIFAINLLAEEQ